MKTISDQDTLIIFRESYSRAAGLMTGRCSAACDPHLSQREVASTGYQGAGDSPVIASIVRTSGAVTPGHPASW